MVSAISSRCLLAIKSLHGHQLLAKCDESDCKQLHRVSSFISFDMSLPVASSLQLAPASDTPLSLLSAEIIKATQHDKENTVGQEPVDKLGD